MPEQVERDVAERDVLLELGGAGDPRAELLRQDQRVVAEPQRVLRDIRRGGAPVGAREFGRQLDLVDRDVAVRRRVVAEPSKGHRCGTPSDAV